MFPVHINSDTLEKSSSNHQLNSYITLQSAIWNNKNTIINKSAFSFTKWKDRGITLLLHSFKDDAFINSEHLMQNWHWKSLISGIFANKNQQKKTITSLSKLLLNLIFQLQLWIFWNLQYQVKSYQNYRNLFFSLSLKMDTHTTHYPRWQTASIVIK